MQCMSLDFFADPDKDPLTEKGKKWLADAIRGIPGGVKSPQWRREMCRNWGAGGGQLVFPEFETHEDRIVVPPFEVPESWALYAGFDYGHRNPSAFEVFAVDHDANVWSVWEYYKSGDGYRAQARAIRSCPYYDRLSFPPVADPSLWALTQQDKSDKNDMKSIAQLFAELDSEEAVFFAKGKAGGDITWAEKVKGDLWWNLDEGEEPRWKIFATCPKLIWEIRKLRYRDWRSTASKAEQAVQEKIVQKDNHAIDAACYFYLMFFEKPENERRRERKYEKLKQQDLISYREWRASERIFGEEPESEKTGIGSMLGESEGDAMSDKDAGGGLW